MLRSAIANASQKDGFGGDVERLFVNACYANQGPSQKRIRPAPMGRAFRVVKRTAHLTVQVAERPTAVSAPSAGRRRRRRAEASARRQAEGEAEDGGRGRRRSRPQGAPEEEAARGEGSEEGRAAASGRDEQAT